MRDHLSSRNAAPITATLLPVPKTQSAVHPIAQYNADRLHDGRQRSSANRYPSMRVRPNQVPMEDSRPLGISYFWRSSGVCSRANSAVHARANQCGGPPLRLLWINGRLLLGPSYSTVNQLGFYACGHASIVNEILCP